jgi:hypothetical protein
MKAGDVAGLALLNMPYAWIGLARDTAGYTLERFDQLTGKTLREPVKGSHVWLRVHCDFDTEQARFSYSADGKNFQPLGGEWTMVFQLKTFQGVRYALFHYNGAAAPGGYADFNAFQVDELRPRGLTAPIPVGRRITLSGVTTGSVLAVDGAAQFRVIDRGRGRIALETADRRYVSVAGSGGAGQVALKRGKPGDAETFQWVDLQRGETLLMSLVTHRYLAIPATPGTVSADHAGPSADRRDGSCFRVAQVRQSLAGMRTAPM